MGVVPRHGQREAADGAQGGSALGLGDPADTGQLWALMGPVSALSSNLRDAAVHIEPDFNEATLEVDGSGEIRIVPLEFLYLGCGLLVSPSFWRGARLLRGG